MGKGLDSVRKIYIEGIAGGKIREMVTACTGHRYTQHSTGVADGVDGFLAFFEPFLKRNPERDIELVRILEDGPWVFCQAYQSLNKGAAQWVTMDMFFTDEGGLILEHWDTIAPFVAETKSGNNMVRGTTEINLKADATESKAIVREYVKQVLQERGYAKVDKFVAENAVQHGAAIGGGSEGLRAWLESEAAGKYEFLFNILGQGDFVVTYGKRHAAGKDVAVFNLYRVADGKIVEMWENAEEISPRDKWGNSGKF